MQAQLRLRTVSTAAPAQPPAQAPCLQVVPLRGWHLPLLQDPCFCDLLPLLQRAVLLQGPERLLSSLAARPPLAPDVLMAYREPQQPLGLLVSQRLNRSGSCWHLVHLRSSEASLSAGETGRMAIEAALVREAIHRSRGAASWIATASTNDSDRLALLRQQGFQPLRHETLWRWEPSLTTTISSPQTLPTDLELRPLNRHTAAAMWQLEQAAMPAQLRQLLDRRVDDLMDQTEQPSLMLFDRNRQQAVAGVRRLRAGARGVAELELSVHPGWRHLLGEPLQLLLEQCALDAEQVLIRSDVLDQERSHWLQSLGMAPQGEEVVMARSVWRRHAAQHNTQMAQRLEAVLGRLQQGQRPIPTPLGR